MHHFRYRDGELFAEDVSLSRIAREVGTPVYVYSSATFERHWRIFDAAFGSRPHLTCYAMKANSNQAVLKLLADLGAGLDIVSGGELARARALSVPGERIVFSGVGKTDEEMRAALDCGIRCFNCESEPELRRLSEIASGMGRKAPVSLRINPDVEAGTHEKISTGRKADKFGISAARAREVYALAGRLPGIEVRGVDMHIGSQITELAPFEAAFRLLAELVEALRADGHDISHVDLGGGLGVPYRGDDDTPPHPEAYVAMVDAALGHLGLEYIIEPGRLIAGNAGVLLGSVLFVKREEGKTFVISDVGMNDLVRPTLYEAYHDILPVRLAPPDAAREVADVVGPVCESGDYIARNRPLPPMVRGDLFAVMTAGAYGAVQAGTYNTRPLVPEVLVRGGEFAVVRPRMEAEEIIARERLAPWQGGSGGAA